MMATAPSKTTRKKKSKKNTTKIRTVREMKVWLMALEEFQEDGWSPTPDQWNVIRDKIYGLEEGSPLPQYTNTATQLNVQVPQYAPAPPQEFVPAPAFSQQTQPGLDNGEVDSAGKYESDFG